MRLKDNEQARKQHVTHMHISLSRSLSSGDFTLKVHLPGGKDNNAFSTACDANKPILKRKAFQGLRSQGNKTPSSSLLPFKSMANYLGILVCALPCKRANVGAGVSGQEQPLWPNRALLCSLLRSIRVSSPHPCARVSAR